MNDLLKIIESELVKRELGTEELINAFNGFARNKHKAAPIFTEKLLAILSRPETALWDKILIFYASSLIGMNQYKDEFLKMVEGLDTVGSNGEEEWKKLYLVDLVKIMRIAATFCDGKKDCPELIIKMAMHLLVSLEKNQVLLDEDLHSLQESLAALGIAAPQLQETKYLHNYNVISDSQEMVTNFLIQDIAKDPILNALTVHKEKETFKGRSADIVITGFEHLNIHQKPLAIEIDGLRFHRVDNSADVLGKDQIRNKIHEQSGYEVWSFNLDLSNSIRSIADQIFERLQKLVTAKLNEQKMILPEPSIQTDPSSTKEKTVVSDGNESEEPKRAEVLEKQNNASQDSREEDWNAVREFNPFAHDPGSDEEPEPCQLQ